MVLGNVAIVLGSGIAGTILSSDAKIRDMFSGAAELVKKHGKEGTAAKSSGGSDQHETEQLLSQIHTIREELQSLTPPPVTVLTPSVKSGSGAYTITALVVVGVIGYAYIKWKGLKLSDMMFVTNRGLADACTAVGNQLDQVSDSVHVTKKHLAGRIDRVDITLDETQEIIEGTRDEVAIIHGDLSAFQADLQSVNLVVQTLESKMGRLEISQDQTVDGINHLCEFTLKLEPAGQSANNVRQISAPIVTAVMTSSLPHLALEPTSPTVTESPRAEETCQVSPSVVAECPAASETSQEEEQKGVSGMSSTGRNKDEASSDEKTPSSAKAASMKTQNHPSSRRLGGLLMPVLGTLLRASAVS